MLKSLFLKVPMQPWLYLLGLLVWYGVLWILSSGNPMPKDAPEIPHLDKLVHFTYFSAGGVCCAMWLRLANPSWPMIRVFVLTALTISLLGALDEYHQSFTPERTGNCPWDWLADTLGGMFGAWAAGQILKMRATFLRNPLD